jgi:hypothetical protein
VQNIARLAKNATTTSPRTSDADCRRALHFAFSQLNATVPPGFFAWLDETHPSFATELLAGAAAKIDNAWMTPHFEAVLADFLCAASAAVAMFQLWRNRDGRVRRR